MSLVLVGGHDRMHQEYKVICSKYGHSVKIYTQMPARFDKVIGNPDGIVVFTGIVSHKMMHTAVKEARRKNIPVLRCHNCGVSSFQDLIKELESKKVKHVKNNKN
jgi:hypothetical protein